MSDDSTPLKAPPPPSILAKDGRKDGAGRQLWKEYVGSGSNVPYVLNPGELRALRDACVMADRMEQLEEKAKTQSLTTRGSQGQAVINPLLAEARQCALAITALLSKIKLPDDQAEGTAAAPRSVGARNAANAKWGKSG